MRRAIVLKISLAGIMILLLFPVFAGAAVFHGFGTDVEGWVVHWGYQSDPVWSNLEGKDGGGSIRYTADFQESGTDAAGVKWYPGAGMDYSNYKYLSGWVRIPDNLPQETWVKLQMYVKSGPDEIETRGSIIEGYLEQGQWYQVKLYINEIKDTGGTADPAQVRMLGILYGSWDNEYTGTVYYDLIEALPTPELKNQEFIKRDDTLPRFVKGTETFYFSGANQYYLFYKSYAMIDEVIEDARRLGLKVLRTWGFCEGIWKEGYCFQPVSGEYHEPTFRKMDYILYKANQCGIRLIIPLVNNWDDKFGGMRQYVNWLNERYPEEIPSDLHDEWLETKDIGDLQYGTEEYSKYQRYHDLFYTNGHIRDWYKAYVSEFLNRVNTITGQPYKEDPTILMWELANEPRCESDPSGITLQGWIEEMADYIKSIDIDPKHLLSTGEEGWYNEGTGGWQYDGSLGVDYILNHQYVSIDACSFHLYPKDNAMTEYQSELWIEEHIDDGHNIVGKPVYLGEFGWKVDREAERIASDILHDFNTNTEEWNIDPEWLDNAYSSIPIRVDSPSKDGNGSIYYSAGFTPVKWTAGGDVVYFSDRDYSDYDHLSGWAYLPFGAPEDMFAELYVKDKDGKWADGDNVSLLPGEWVRVSISKSQIEDAGLDISSIHRLGIQVKRADTNYSGNVYYDLIEGVEGDLDDAVTQLETRNRIYADWYEKVKDKEGDGVCFWLLSGHQDDGALYPDYDHYTVYAPEDGDTCAVIEKFHLVITIPDLGISLAPWSWSIGTMPADGSSVTTWTEDTPVEGGCFTVTNIGQFSTNLSIAGSDSDSWELRDSPGVNAFSVGWGQTLIKETEPLYENITLGGVDLGDVVYPDEKFSFDLQFKMPTSSSDFKKQSIIITVIAQ